MPSSTRSWKPRRASVALKTRSTSERAVKRCTSYDSIRGILRTLRMLLIQVEVELGFQFTEHREITGLERKASLSREGNSNVDLDTRQSTREGRLVLIQEAHQPINMLCGLRSSINRT